MKILIGHNYYQQAGGEDAVFRSHVALLKSFGHEVCVYERHNDEIKKDPLSRLAHLSSLRWSKASYDQMKEVLSTFKPDLAHFHNIFFVMTPAVLQACKDQGVPVAVSFHNFRPMCINGLFFRDNKPCEDCLTNSRFSGIIHRCFRNSIGLSIAAVDMIDYHWRHHTWDKTVDRFVVATQFTKDKYTQAGIDADKISVLPHFVEAPLHRSSSKGEYALYAGRLSQEKGVDLLLEAWQDLKDIPLYIVGSGPKKQEMEDLIKAKGMAHVKLLGFLKSDEYARILAQAKFMVVPSVCYENFPRVVVEAYAQGIPVLANRLGTLQEVVQEDATGLLFSGAEDLRLKARQMMADKNKYIQLSTEAHRSYEEKYAPMPYYKGLMDIYESVIIHA